MVRTYSAILTGMQAHPIQVEAEAVRGTPQLILIGLASQTVLEARERISAAIFNCGIRLKSLRTVINLAPADLPKKGSVLDLAIAVSLLKINQQISGSTDKWLFLGELSLNGKLKPIKGALPICLKAKDLGFDHIVLPSSNISEVAIIDQIYIHPLDHLKQMVGFNFAEDSLPAMKPQPFSSILTSKQAADNRSDIDLPHIIGQEHAKRALTIAAAGAHNLLMVGPPGSGKTMLARSLAKLLPQLPQSNAIEVTAIHSVIGANQSHLITDPPFRNPHHTISRVGLIGGGHQLKPGEISLAHRGVLFLDELTEFDRATLETIRQPLESGVITHTRQTGHATYPCQCQLIAATNPCPCGWWQSSHRSCRCSIMRRQKYWQKLSGPFLDRIDIQIWMDQPKSGIDLRNKLAESSVTTTSQTNSQTLQQITQAHILQKERLKPIGKQFNSQLSSFDLRQTANISPQAWQLIKQARNKLSLSLRATFNVLRLAQTIADLTPSTTIEPEFVAEALQYRQLPVMD